MREERLVKLEEDLKRVTGIRHARVVGVDDPSEIHIVATPDRSPKQLVRDVQSLASAGFGLEIDHRIVSIVQLGEHVELPNGTAPEVAELSNTRGRRPEVEAVVLSSSGETGWVKVTLRWLDETTTEGAGAATSSRDSRARAASAALQQALDPVLKARGAHLDVHQILLQPIGTNDSVLVQGFYSEKGTVTPFVGSAIVHDDVATAAVHALLQAVNRKLESAA